MRKLRVMLLPALLIATGAQAEGVSHPADARHENGYGTPKIEYRPLTPEIGSKGRPLAEAFLRENAERYGIAKDLSNVRFKRERQSLAGRHYHFEQVHEGVVVDDAQVVVTLDPSASRVTMIFNNVYPFPVTAASKPTFDTEVAYDRAWEDLAPRAGLLGDPSATLKVRAEGKTTRLVYEVVLSVAAPLGSWEYVIDAKSGSVIEKRDRNIYRRPKSTPPVSGPVLDRRQAFAEWRQRRAANEATMDEGVATDGTAVVFDPDPRTTLKRTDLQDDSDDAQFEDAYVERQLLGLTKRGDEIFLEGPWVRVEEFDSPQTLPSKSKNGKWDFKRGNNAFNDVMTYFHIDQNQRYIQSLGFKDATGIQYAPIKVDTDGASGADNSYFTPTQNTLSFGHGCVDDNEDADVILHEYGHALQWSINDDWDGGDTGAIGEGFGDYWAASYSLSTPNGADYHPAQVFSWDAHGDGSKCWPGRVLDATHLTYDPSRRYPAHGTIGSNSTDELWSTPLFQALLAAKSQGIPREEMDRIILQSHFGLGSGVTMRELANATINAAATLYPNGRHADIFREKFQKQGIIDEPVARFEIEGVEIQGAGDDGVMDPGDQATLILRVKNVGTKAAQSAAATVSTTVAQATVTDTQADLGSVAIGDASEFRVNLAVARELTCGEKIPLNVIVRHDGGEESLNWTIGTGRALGLDLADSPNLAIPDNDQEGVIAEMTSSTAGVVTDEFNVDVVIKHPYPRDLEVQLISPSGKAVYLAKRDASAADDIIGNYPRTLKPSESLAGLLGESLTGPWRLSLVDSATRDAGTLESWALRNITSYECSP